MEVSVEVKAEVDVDFHIFSSPHVELNSYSVEVNSGFNSNLQFKGKLEGSVKIGKVNIPIGGPFSVEAEIKAFAEVNGEITYSVEIVNGSKISYEDGLYKKTCTKSCEQSLDIMVSLEMGFKLTAYICAFSIEIVDASVAVSALLEAESKLSRKVELEFSDETAGISDVIELESKINLYLPLLSISVGDEDSLVSDLGISRKFEIITKENAPVVVPIFNDKVSWILYKDEIPLNPEEPTTLQETTTEEVTTDGETVVTDKEITLSTFALSMTSGGTETITPYIPEGYSEGDLQWSTSDASVATVSAGKITAKASGSATITVKTKDGQYTGKCIVVVE